MTHDTPSLTTPQARAFEADAASGFPNSPLPAVIYRRVFEPEAFDASALAERFETLFTRHGWRPEWRYGLFDFDHFHSTAHEALGVFRGHARARLGGPHGAEIELHAGDVLILPAGVGHACLQDEDGFSMVGAYPPGQRWEVERGDVQALAAAKARVAAVALPDDDPVGGELLRLWR
ncbi:cupin domain-containing protein [Salinicola halophilus]|uniref:cupin domain-containing protein n=1 Tax=Salinicola halophilus TaxID=184065 RepID=UPI000DA1AF0E|nr:cupin domain-containing protein [Salinicola halophilus]